MREADNRRLSDFGMGNESAFDFGSAHAVARNIDHVVNPSCNPIITVRISPTSIASEIFTGIGGEIGLEKPFMITPHSPHLTRPAIDDTQIAIGRAFQQCAVAVDKHRLHAEHRL